MGEEKKERVKRKVLRERERERERRSERDRKAGDETRRQSTRKEKKAGELALLSPRFFPSPVGLPYPVLKPPACHRCRARSKYI